MASMSSSVSLPTPPKAHRSSSAAARHQQIIRYRPHHRLVSLSSRPHRCLSFPLKSSGGGGGSGGVGGSGGGGGGEDADDEAGFWYHFAVGFKKGLFGSPFLPNTLIPDVRG